MVKKLWGFEDFSPSLGMLSATMNVAKSAQIYPKAKLLNTPKNRDFSAFQK
jgi:hypothetical protein